MELASLLSIAVVVTKIELHRKVGSNPFPMHSLIWFKLLRTTNWKKSFLCGPSASNVASVGNLTWKVYFVTKAWVAEPNSTAGMLWNEDLGNNRQDMFTRAKITERIWTECRRNNSKVMTTVNQNRQRKITSPPMQKKIQKKNWQRRRTGSWLVLFLDQRQSARSHGLPSTIDWKSCACLSVLSFLIFKSDYHSME